MRAERSTAFAPDRVSSVDYFVDRQAKIENKLIVLVGSGGSRRISAKAAEAAGVQDNKANGDAVATGVALVLFWPAAFFVKGNGATGAEVAHLKGEMDAIEEEAYARSVGSNFGSRESIASRMQTASDDE